MSIFGPHSNSQPEAEANAASGSFVTRSGAQLILNNQPFRFSGTNIYWLGLDENVNGVDYPTRFRVDDALTTAQEMGASVIRSHTLGVSVGCAKCLMPAPGTYNDAAFDAIDYAIAAARARNLRLIIPLSDQWRYFHGGKHNFTNWLGYPDSSNPNDNAASSDYQKRQEANFYTDPKVITAFQGYINHILTHTNRYTGLALKDDPTIMAWETGNEIWDATDGWTQTIATYIKTLAPKQLVSDGSAANALHLTKSRLALSAVDIFGGHFYPLDINFMLQDATMAKQAGKVYYVGEYDWTNAPLTATFQAAIEQNTAISGDLFWSLFGHNDNYGYVQHLDNYTIHYPGSSAAMRTMAQNMRNHALKMRGLNPAAVAPAVPATPLITEVNQSSGLVTWRGVAGADTYTVERLVKGGNWTTICNRCATDYTTPWKDASKGGIQSWYRVKAHNLAGVAGDYSATFPAGAPVPVTAPAPIVPAIPAAGSTQLIDDLNDFSKIFSHTANLTFDTTNAIYFEGDSSRLMRGTATNEEVIWKQAGMTRFEAVAFFWPGETVSPFSFFTSSDGANWTAVNPVVSGSSANWNKSVYSLGNLSNANYLKLRWNNTEGQFWSPQISKMTITAGAVALVASVATTITDNMTDFSKTFSHSANLTFDTTNVASFENVASRLMRSSPTNEEVSWKLANLKSFQLTAFFWPTEAVSAFSFYTSADGLNWTEVTAATSGGGGNWAKYIYTLGNLSGVNYVKVRWNNTGGQYWNPQISQAILTT